MLRHCCAAIHAVSTHDPFGAVVASFDLWSATSTSVLIASLIWDGSDGQALAIRVTAAGRVREWADGTVPTNATEGQAASGRRCPDAAKSDGCSGNSLSFNNLQSGGGGNRTRKRILRTTCCVTICESRICTSQHIGRSPWSTSVTIRQWLTRTCCESLRPGRCSRPICS